MRLLMKRVFGCFRESAYSRDDGKTRLSETCFWCESDLPQEFQMPTQSSRSFEISLLIIQIAPPCVTTGPDVSQCGRTVRQSRLSRSVQGGIWLLACIGFAALHSWGQDASSDSVGHAMQQGASAMAAGDFAAAVAAYSTVTRSQPQLAEGHFNLGLAFERDGELDKAGAELETALRLKPELRGANLFSGIVAYKQNRYKDAERFLHRETLLDPTNAKAFMWLGVCRLAQDDARGAIAPLDKAYALDPKDADILYHRGRAYLLVANASYGAMFELDHDS